MNEVETVVNPWDIKTLDELLLVLKDTSNIDFKDPDIDFLHNSLQSVATQLRDSLQAPRHPSSLFFITVFYVDEAYSIKRRRCWGGLYSLEMAKDLVLNNRTDIYEMGYYNLALIEELAEGIPTISCRNNLWYNVKELDTDKYDVKEIDCPEPFDVYCGWALG